MTNQDSQLLYEEVAKLNPSPVVELYELNLEPITNDPRDVLYFHNGSGGVRDNVTYLNGDGDLVEYQPMPIQVTGFELGSSGEPARPKLSIMNWQGMLSSIILSTNDMVGAKVVRRRTFVKYLNLNQEEPSDRMVRKVSPKIKELWQARPRFPDDVYIVEQKVTENRKLVEFELGAGFDLDGHRFPARHVTGAYCMFPYRGPGCGFGHRVVLTNNRNELHLGTNQNGRWLNGWLPGVMYRALDCVGWTYGGYYRVYECITHLIANDPDAQPPSSKWVERQRYRGTWSEEDSYLTNDTVSIVRVIHNYRDKMASSSVPVKPDRIVILAKAKMDLVAGMPAPPSPAYWDVDTCTKGLTACRYRYDGAGTNQTLRFGGFPGCLNMPSEV